MRGDRVAVGVVRRVLYGAEILDIHVVRWLGNAKDLIISGTASVLETVGCRDDIMLYLISMGLDPKMSFKTMEAVRKGKVKAGKAGDWPMWVEEMRKHDVPEWYIESLAKIGYLFPKAHAVAYVAC